MIQTDHRVANREIAQIISRAVEEFPGLRFGQILQALDVVKIKAGSVTGEIEIVDEYHVDPGVIAVRVRRAITALRGVSNGTLRKEDQ